MKKLVSMILVLAMVISLCSVVSAGEGVVYVAPGGTGNGTIDAPFGDIQSAINAVGSGTIYLRGGVYKVSDSIELKSNITISAYNNEEVIVDGGTVIDASKFAKVTDEAVLNRIVEKSAKDKIYSVNLKECGIEDFGTIDPYRSVDMEEKSTPPILFMNNKMMTIARYPNDSYLYTGGVLNDTEFVCKEDRYAKWKDAEDVHLFGYFMHDWAEAYILAKLNVDKKSFQLAGKPSYGISENRRYYVYNLLEELDAPGEWYLDRSTGMLYVIPEGELNANTEVSYSVMNKPVFNGKEKDNIKITGIKVRNARSYGVLLDNCHKVTIDFCEFTGIGDWCVYTIHSNESNVLNNYFHDIGAGGVTLRNGDYYTLEMGNSKVCNNKVMNFGKIMTTYSAGITIFGLGNLCAHNEIAYAPHEGIQFSGNDNIFEYNEIYKVCLDTSDCGAIYTGRSWIDRGNVIRYNYFHDLVMTDVTTDYKMQAVYLDDMMSGVQVYGNVFNSVDAVGLYGGGRDNTFENNVMINCREPLTVDQRGIDWMNCGPGSSIYEKLVKVDYKNGLWKEKYPELENILEDNPELPKYNVIRNNVEYRSAGYDLSEPCKKYGTIENNIEVKNANVFKDYKNGDFNIVEDSEVYEKIPDFKAIPFDEIGIQEVIKEEDNSVKLAIGKKKAIVNGTEKTLDVPPQIIDSRTLVPVRFISESFDLDVDWDDATKTVTVGDNIKLTIGDNKIYVGDKAIEIDVPAMIIDGRTVLPLRAVSEALNKEVYWNNIGLIVISNETLDLSDIEAETIYKTLG